MNRLSLFLLGSFQASIGQVPITNFPTDKVRALLTYLALEHDKAHRREHLATLLWGDHEQKVALRNLRLSLHRMRQTINQISPGLADQLFITSRQTIQLNKDYLTLDAWEFEAGLDIAEQHEHSNLASCSDCLDQLTQTANLYNGDLLAGLSVADSLEFEQWLSIERERLHQKQLEALKQLTSAQEQHGHFSVAREYALRLLILEPWLEEVHRQLMRFYAINNQQKEALAQFERCKDILAQELGVEPEQETVDLYDQIRQGDFSLSIAENLPAPATPFIGREKEIAQVKGLVTNPDCRIISLIGPGGVGKTRLSIEIANNVLENKLYRDGVFFVPLHNINTPEFLASTIAEGMMIPLFGGHPPEEQLLDQLDRKSMFVVLDNYEHLITLDGGRALLRRILEARPAIKFLITSRERLQLSGEWVVDVNGLSFPDASSINQGSMADGITMIEQYSAVELFTRSAKRIRNSFSFTKEDQIGVSQICQLVDGMPLALELAASWTRLLTPKEIVQEIENGFEVLTTSFQDVPERHQSIIAVFDYSWQTLSEKGKTVFKALSIFRGGFDREAAKEIVGADLIVLAELVNKSFLQVSSGGRYSIHELLRQYAREKLEISMQAFENVKDRHSAYFANYVQKRQMPSAETLQEIGREIDNIRPVWQWAVHRQRYEDLQKVTFGLWAYLEAMGAYTEGNETFEKAGNALAQVNDNDISRLTALASIYVREAWFKFRLGELIESQVKATKGRELLDNIDSPSTLYESLIARSIFLFTEFYLGNFEEVISESNAIAKIALPAQDFFSGRIAYNILGLVYQVYGDYQASIDNFNKGDALSRQIGDMRSVTLNQVLVSSAYISLNQLDQARTLILQGLEGAKQFQDQFTVSMGECYLGYVDMAEANYAEAEKHFYLGLAGLEKISDFYGIALAKIGVANLLMIKERFGDAEREFFEGLQLAHSQRLATFSMSNLIGLAQARRQLGSISNEEWEKCLTIAYYHPATRHDRRMWVADQLSPTILDNASEFVISVTADPKNIATQLIESILSS